MSVRQQYQCHQGKGINYKKKENYREKKTQNLSLTINLQNTENWSRIQKTGCLVVFSTKRLFTFPKYKIPTDTRYNRDKAAKLVKNFFLPQSSQSTKEKRDEECNLSYFNQLPKGKHGKVEKAAGKLQVTTGKAAGI